MLRPAVITRKVGGCNKTLWGALVHGVLASLMVSCKRRGKRFLDLARRLLAEQRSAGCPLGSSVGRLIGDPRDRPALETREPLPSFFWKNALCRCAPGAEASPLARRLVAIANRLIMTPTAVMPRVRPQAFVQERRNPL